MSLTYLKQIVSDISYLEDELNKAPIPVDMRRDAPVTVEGLIKYLLEDEDNIPMLEHIIWVAKECKKLGIKL